MPRGRRPLPPAVKKLRGNPGKRKIVPDRAMPMKGTATPGPNDVAALPTPPPPATLGPIGKAEWKRIAAEMVRLGTLRELDRTAFELRCQAYERRERARKQLGAKLVYETPTGAIRPHPLVKIIEAADKQIRSFDIEFGLTPASRARVAHVTGEQRQAALPLPEPQKAQPTPQHDAPEGAAPQPLSDDAFFAGPPTRH